MDAEVKNKQYIKKLFILVIKYMPTIHLVGMLFNNTIYHLDYCYTLSYIIDFIIGFPIINLLIYILASYIFEFCIYHRIIIVAVTTNVVIAFIDSIYKLPCRDIALLAIYYIVAAIAILIITIIHIKNNDKTKFNKRNTPTNNK